MKKVFLLASLCFATIAASAQDLITKIPSTASAVISIKGKNITDLVSVAEFENSKFGKLLVKELSRETDGKISNLEDFGINLKQNFYYFLEAKKGVFNHNFLIPLNNKEGFESMFSERELSEIVRENGYSYKTDEYSPVVVMWDDSMILMIVSQDENNYYDYDYLYEEEAVEAVDAMEGYPVMTFDELEHDFGTIKKGTAQETVFRFTNTGDSPLIISDAKSSCGCTVPEVPEAPIAPGETGELLVKFNGSGYNAITKTITVTANTEETTQQLKIKAFIVETDAELTEAVDVAEEVEETVIEATESVYDNNDYYNNYDDSDYYKKQEKERKQREKKREARKKEALASILKKAKDIFAGTYSNDNILKNRNYVKSISGGGDEATLWVDDFGAIYADAFSELMSGSMGSSYGMFDFNRMYGGMGLTAKLNFEDNNASLKTLYTMNDNMAQYNREMYDGKMNKDFFKYFNEDKIQGYFSVNASTEGILKSYPKMIESMFAGIEKEHIEDLVPIGTRLFSILLDEEAIADVVRGDMLFVMTGIEQKEVTYTTYEYDENYESKEVTKTKNETIPTFLFMITSEEREIFKRLLNIGMKEGEVGFEEGVYFAQIPDVPFELSMIFKDDAIIIGNSYKELLAIQKGANVAKVSGKHKKLISKSATSVYINGKQILNSIPEGLVPNSYQGKVNYISENVEDVIFSVSKMQGNVMEGEMILNTPEGKGHKNSLAYFLNVIDALVD